MAGPSLSSRALALKAPATLAIMGKAKALARQGVDVVSFGAGEPDFDTPEPIRRAAAEALNSGQTHYMPTLGDTQTREVIAEKLVRENGLVGVSAEHVAISTGAKQSLYLVCQCLLGDHDRANEVLLPVPAWVSYGPMAGLAGGKVVELPTTASGGFKLTPEQLRRAITPRSRLLVLNTPSNPCGTMYTPDELRALAAVVAESARAAPDLVVVVDEIYEKITFAGIPHFSIGSVPEVAERTVTINGLSKAYAMTGWRVGYAASSGEFGLRLIRAMDALQGQMTSCITSFVYPAIRKAIQGCAEDVERFRAEFARRAAMMDERMRGVPGMVAPRPTGAFYLFPNVSAYIGRRSPEGRPMGTSVDLAGALLDEAHVAVVPGEEFGGAGRDHLRFSFACSAEQIEKGMDRVARFVSQMR
jgi:aspartate aminotransferase